MLPNDVFKRPGAHHAVEVDPDKLAQLRAAIDPLEQLGDAGALAALLGRTPEELRRPREVSDTYRYCIPEEARDFGLRYYGPMFSRMNLLTEFGAALIPQRDPLLEPISHVWLELSPYFPQRVAPAAEIHVDLELLAPPARAWDELLREMAGDHDLFQDEEESDDAFDDRIAARLAELERENRALIERWRLECRPEVEAFCSKLREIGDRGGLVATWHSEQGWL